MSLGFGMTPIQRHMMKRWVTPGPPPPSDGERATLAVRDTDGLGCEGAKYPLLALRGMDVDLWVTHREAGSFHLVAEGRTTRIGEVLSAHFRAGQELTLTATGRDARRALETLVQMAEAPA